MSMPPGNRSIEARAPFTIMVKPVGSACNLRCEYCYYLDASGSSPSGRMSVETLQELIRQYIIASPGPAITFTWHGGEPMLAGLDFYREAYPDAAMETIETIDIEETPFTVYQLQER